MHISKVSFKGYDYGDGYPISGGKIEKHAWEQRQKNRELDYRESLRSSKLGRSSSSRSSGYSYDSDGWAHRSSTYVDADGWVHHY